MKLFTNIALGNFELMKSHIKETAKINISICYLPDSLNLLGRTYFFFFSITGCIFYLANLVK